jgi:hypothetical protein
MVNVAYGVCTNSWERVGAYITPRIGGRPLIALWGQTSISSAYNTILTAVQHLDLDMLVLLHDDLELVDPPGEAKLLAAVNEPDVALVGVAGGSNVTGLAWWNAATVGHQRIDSGMLDFGPRVGDVESVEGSLMALSPWAIQHLRFDEDFSGWHGYDEIGLAARRAGKRVVVADVDTHHHTHVGFDSEASHQAWLAADEKFRRKYGL